MTTYEQRQKLQAIGQRIKDIVPDIFGSVEYKLKSDKGIEPKINQSLDTEPPTFQNRQQLRKIGDELKVLFPNMFAITFNLTKFSRCVKIDYRETVNSGV
jgi:hypothetical protein